MTDVLHYYTLAMELIGQGWLLVQTYVPDAIRVPTLAVMISASAWGISKIGVVFGMVATILCSVWFIISLVGMVI